MKQSFEQRQQEGQSDNTENKCRIMDTTTATTRSLTCHMSATSDKSQMLFY